MRAAETFAKDLAGYQPVGRSRAHLNHRIDQVQPLQFLAAGPSSVVAFPADHEVARLDQLTTA